MTRSDPYDGSNRSITEHRGRPSPPGAWVWGLPLSGTVVTSSLLHTAIHSWHFTHTFRGPPEQRQSPARCLHHGFCASRCNMCFDLLSEISIRRLLINGLIPPRLSRTGIPACPPSSALTSVILRPRKRRALAEVGAAKEMAAAARGKAAEARAKVAEARAKARGKAAGAKEMTY